MPRKRVIHKSADIENIKDKFDEEKRHHTDVESVNLIEHAGGSINNLQVKSKSFNTWLDAHRANNPFIGKHVTSAPEEYTEEVRLEDDEELSAEETATFLQEQQVGLGDFDPNSDFGIQVEEHGEALIGDGNHDTRFIDINITENITNKLLGRSSEEIEEESIKAMQSYHGDSHYVPEIDVSKIVEVSSIRLIAEKKEAEEQLKLTDNKAQ